MQTFSMVASSDKTRSESIFKINKYGILNSAAIYGPNASGKTNIIEAIGLMRDIIVKSAQEEPGTNIPVVPFKFDSSTIKEPTFFETSFIVENVRYQYGFTSTARIIIEEWLFATPQNRSQLWFERKYNSDTERPEVKFGSFFRGERQKLLDRTRNDSLFLSVASHWNNEVLLPIYNWFKFNLRIIDVQFDLSAVTASALYEADKNGNNRGSIKEMVLDFLHDSGLDISDIKVIQESVDKITFPKEMPRELREEMISSLRKSPPLAVKLFYNYKGKMEHDFLELFEESHGTQRIFDFAVPWISTVQNGFTVIVDELERSLHPHLSKHLINFIQNPQKNTTGAQLIFSTHDTHLMSQELFRRDQIWFTDKDEEGATHLYSMWDYKKRKPRKGESMRKGYLSGRYGAIPIIEDFAEIWQEDKAVQ
jgi:AAA15 family ATPase/GTPase